ncbi:pectinesterase family protein [Flavobacterium sp. CF136]|uniref:pectinesterase family protein n=1 Tax=Flavobacterium sp. (strain CF136) TaxID=1144313 RepID=UPI000271743C|nr:pectinesterase family protein [Flavobacterium sp. CF136]EJL61927.1 pectin methylesterase [Flavobacterium sp. CF136]
MKKTFLTFYLCLFVFNSALYAQKDKDQYDIIVAADGSGTFTKVQEAFDAVPENNSKRIIIFVKPGIYKEKLKLSSKKKKVTLLGESYKTTVLTFDDYAEIAGGTSKSFSVLIQADDFTAENITFENTIDSQLPQYKKGGQAVALMVNGDRAIFHLCKITGFQDTFYLKSNTRTYIKDCIIEGTTDFIFGSGISLFENCFINSIKGSHITASNQDAGKNKYGFVFKDCVFLNYNGNNTITTTLGRPWGAGANVVVLNSYEGSHIIADGWAIWSKDPEHKAFKNWETTYYAEYNCFGPGYNPKNRLSWTHQLSKKEASEYTKEKIFAANTTTAANLEGDWNPETENDKCREILPSKNAKNADGVFQKGFN